MKKLSSISLPLLLLFCSSQLVFAQAGSLDIGIIGGPGMARLRGEFVPQKYEKPALSYAAGVSAQYHFTNMFSVSAGIMNELKGSKAEVTMTDYRGVKLGTAKMNNRMSYLVIPVMARFSFGYKVKMVLGCGLYGGYLLGASLKTSGTNMPFNQSTKIYFEKKDFGTSLSAGVSVPLKEGFSLEAEVRGNTGLYNISRNRSYVGDRVWTSSANLLIGLSYRLGEKKS